MILCSLQKGLGQQRWPLKQINSFLLKGLLFCCSTSKLNTFTYTGKDEGAEHVFCGSLINVCRGHPVAAKNIDYIMEE